MQEKLDSGSQKATLARCVALLVEFVNVVRRPGICLMCQTKISGNSIHERGPGRAIRRADVFMRKAAPKNPPGLQLFSRIANLRPYWCKTRHFRAELRARLAKPGASETLPRTAVNSFFPSAPISTTGHLPKVSPFLPLAQEGGDCFRSLILSSLR
jgi:hypothetical protein